MVQRLSRSGVTEGANKKVLPAMSVSVGDAIGGATSRPSHGAELRPAEDCRQTGGWSRATIVVEQFSALYRGSWATELEEVRAVRPTAVDWRLAPPDWASRTGARIAGRIVYRRPRKWRSRSSRPQAFLSHSPRPPKRHRANDEPTMAAPTSVGHSLIVGSS